MSWDADTGTLSLATEHAHDVVDLRLRHDGQAIRGDVVSHQRLSTARCLVVSLPLGVSRIGFYRHPLPSQGAPLLSGRCRPDDT